METKSCLSVSRHCNKLVEENFRDPDIHAAMQDGFDVVALNMWGDREVVSVNGKSFTEKTFAAALNPQGPV